MLPCPSRLVKLAWRFTPLTNREGGRYIERHLLGLTDGAHRDRCVIWYEFLLGLGAFLKDLSQMCFFQEPYGNELDKRPLLTAKDG